MQSPSTGRRLDRVDLRRPGDFLRVRGTEGVSVRRISSLGPETKKSDQALGDFYRSSMIYQFAVMQLVSHVGHTIWERRNCWAS